MSFVLLSCHFCFGQLSGARGGVHSGGNQIYQANTTLGTTQAEGYITIEGAAEMRLDATKIRIVLAVTSEDETSIGCREKVSAITDSLKKEWTRLGVNAKDIDQDFIAILPIYEWKINGNVATETKTGHRMQTNLNIAVPNEAKAVEVLDAAFKEGITDVIGFDYWSEEIEAQKAKTLAKAISNAQAKAKTLLAIFDEKPKAINITEKTKTIFPSQLYESFQNVYASSAVRPNRRDLTFIPAYRPKNTYYKGFQAEVDSSQNELAMSRQISIISTVQIYYRSPGADLKKEQDEKE